MQTRANPIGISLAGLRRHWADLVIALVLALGSGAAILHASAQIDDSLFSAYAGDVWFQGDADRTLQNFTDRRSDHYRTQVHPVSSLLLNSFVTALGKVWKGSRLQQARHAMAVLSGVWAVLLFTVLRLRGSRRTHAACFSLLGLSGAAFLFWYSVPETYGAGSITLLVVLLAAAIAERRGTLRDRWIVAASAVSLSITVTNWMAGLLLAFRTRPWRRALMLSLAALGIVFVLALVQKHYFPSARIFLWGAGGEGEFIAHGPQASRLDRIRVLYIDSFSAPRPQTLAQKPPYHDQLSVQHAVNWTANGFGFAAILLWVTLLGAGLCAAWPQLRARGTFATILLLLIAGQTALHLVYGEETFLYALHIFPCLVILAAESRRLGAGNSSAGASTGNAPSLTRMAPPLTGIAASLTGALALLAAGCAVSNNQAAWRIAVNDVRAGRNARDDVRAERTLHPQRPWPRGEGHVVLALPGTALSDKAWHEPGGDVSPAPGTFGISFWVVDAGGRVLVTSDTIPLQEMTQSFDGDPRTFAPSILTHTRWFDVRWTHGDGARLDAHVTPSALPAGAALWMVARSVGPSGAALKSVAAEGNALRIGESWQVTLGATPAGWAGGDEHAGEIVLQTSQPSVATTSASGWSFAAAKLGAGASDIQIERVGAGTQTFTPWAPEPLWAPQVPDKHFAAAAYAAQMHLLMGLTDHSTRPGEPLNYDSEWLRDASMIVATLARAGQPAIAAELSKHLAAVDFEGGFGAEADAPGLALWSLNEVSNALRDPAFDRAVMPAARRKVGWIERCLNAREPVMFPGVRAQAFEPDPALVCEPARLGLAVGRMDGHFPILFINAVDYAGLESAARLADRAGDEDLALRARTLAAPIPARWEKLFTDKRRARATALLHDYARQPSKAVQDFLRGKADRDRNLTIADNFISASGDDRTYISALWPTDVASGDAASRALLTQMESRWSPRRFDPANARRHPWTYFDFAEAHQWLLLGRADRAWQILNWYFAQDASPGLYAWWEGSGEENSADAWANTRGWIEPNGVSPHYWAEAESLALQMDALTYADVSGPAPRLVLGAGVPKEWSSSALDSDWISTAVGSVRWRLAGATVSVECTCAPETQIDLRGALAEKTLIRPGEAAAPSALRTTADHRDSPAPRFAPVARAY